LRLGRLPKREISHEKFAQRNKWLTVETLTLVYHSRKIVCQKGYTLVTTPQVKDDKALTLAHQRTQKKNEETMKDKQEKF